MAFELKFLPTAENNSEEATEYYSNISFEVLKHFNDNLDKAFLRIEFSPYFSKEIWKWLISEGEKVALHYIL